MLISLGQHMFHAATTIIMTSFKWSKKSTLIGQRLTDFEGGDEIGQVLVPVVTETMAPSLTNEEKVQKLQKDAMFAVDHEKYWMAINKWNEILLLTPTDAKIHEMKSQVLNLLHEIHPAKESAEAAVAHSGKAWHVAYQTLGRCCLNLGQIDSAIRAFSRAIHLKPDEKEIWDEDLKWALSLKLKEKEMEDDKFFEEVEKYRNMMKNKQRYESDDDFDDGRDPCDMDTYHHCIEDLPGDGSSDQDQDDDSNQPLINPETCITS